MASKSMKKKFIKHIIKYNVFDYFIPRLRHLYKRLGILDFMDTRFYWLAWRLCRWAFMKKLWHGETTGVCHAPQTGAAIFVANHNHALDPFISACRLPRKVHWVSKIENYQMPFFRPILQCTGSIPLRRGESDMNAIRLIKQELNRGEIVGMFPEGTRSRNGYLGRFHTGAARLCIEHNIPYIPVGIIGSYHNKMGDKIDVHYGKPVYPNGMKLTYENSKNFAEQMRQDILRLSKAVSDPALEMKTEKISPVKMPSAIETTIPAESISKMH